MSCLLNFRPVGPPSSVGAIMSHAYENMIVSPPNWPELDLLKPNAGTAMCPPVAMVALYPAVFVPILALGAPPVGPDEFVRVDQPTGDRNWVVVRW